HTLLLLTTRRPQRSTLFPYTTLFRSHGAEEEEGTGLPGHETDIAALPGREPLVKTTGRRVLERRSHRTDGHRCGIGDDLHGVRQVRVLVLEMEHHVPPLRHRQHQGAPAEP